MAGVLQGDLDEYSRFAVERLLVRFPDWDSMAKLTPRPDGAGNVVEFNLSSPSPAIEYGLWVSTADEELTVGFHTHHNHYTDYESSLNPAQVDAGLDHIADILAERVGVVSWYRQGGFAGSRTIELPHDGPLPGLLDGLAINGLVSETLGQCDRATLRSWTGQFDRDE